MYGQIVAVANINPAEYNVYCVDISNDTEKKKMKEYNIRFL